MDTGAGLSVISESLWRELKTPLLYKHANPTVLTATGQKVKIVGMTNLSFDEFPKKSSTFAIVRNMKTPIIIGSDLLQDGNAQINFANKTILWYHQTMPFDLAQRQISLNEIIEIPESEHPELQNVLEEYKHLFGPLE